MHKAGRLDGKVALITGAGRHRGLGEAIARRFAEEGAHVLLTDLGRPAGPLLTAEHIGSADELEQVAAGIRAHLGDAAARSTIETALCDVRDELQVEAAVSLTIERFGRIDILVNNAGVGFISKPFYELTSDEWDLILAVNLKGAFLVTRAVARHMIALHQAGDRAGGRIINIASKAAKSATARYVPYTSSKHGLVGFTRGTALDLAPYGITVNAVCPNHVTTGLGAKQNAARAALDSIDVALLLERRNGQIPLGRVGLPQDTANACLFLASAEASYITGEAMNVSGGEEMH